MADSKISGLPAITQINATDVYVVVDTAGLGTTSQITHV